MRSFSRLLAAASFAVMATALHGCDNGGSSGKASADGGSTMGPLEEGTNRQGRDISQSGTRTDNAAQCADRCAANAACKAMSFAKDSGDKGGICFLKSDVPAATENAAVTSAVKAGSAP